MWGWIKTALAFLVIGVIVYTGAGEWFKASLDYRVLFWVLAGAEVMISVIKMGGK